MQLFSEIYGAYFAAVGRILEDEQISEAEIQRIIHETAFRDSILFLPQKLRPESEESWGLLRRNANGTLSRITNHAPPQFVTLMQKRWLKAKLSDPKMRLFLSDEALQLLDRALADVSPLYPAGVFRYFDIFSDGDPFERESYRTAFRRILSAIHDNAVLEISYISGKGRTMRGVFLPLKMEYSRKNDKFRVYCCRIGQNGIQGNGLLNVGRITGIRKTRRIFPNEGLAEEVFRRRRCSEPVVVRISEERNGIERFMMEFASYEKHTERDEQSRTCTVKLWYDIQDETEVLIRLLGFGPVLEILAPSAFRAQAAERVAKQSALLQEKKLQKISKNT